ncbi:MAG: segregation/condensation protein A [Clostridia bacterium]|nr:segregation/condensation protein A [Clostridia bacterium]
MENIQYKLDLFEGPLDLLLTLIQKHKIDINDIPISLLCEQYMTYIRANLDMGLEVASDFLYMASELMLIKSRMLLPRNPETDEDPRDALRDTVLEYQKAKLAASELSDLFGQYGTRMIKEQDDIAPDRTFVADHSIALLQAALIHAMTEAKVTPENRQAVLEPIVHQTHVAVQGVMIQLLDKLQTGTPVYLDDYFTDSGSRSEIIAKFLSLLELMKTQTVGLPEEEWETGDSGVLQLRCHVPVILLKLPDKEQLAALEEYA